MKRALCTLVMVLAVVITAHGADMLPSVVEGFLQSRQVLGAVRFAEGSAVLSESARKEIDRVVPALRKIDNTKQIIRIEGFSSPSGNDVVNVPISMLRAKAVVDYIHQKYKLAPNLYLTGYGFRELGASSAEISGRAEFAVYDSTWDFEPFVAEKSIIK